MQAINRRIVVTRHQEAAAFVRLRGVEALLHDLPHRNDTVRLGLQAVSEDVEGCLFRDCFLTTARRRLQAINFRISSR